MPGARLPGPPLDPRDFLRTVPPFDGLDVDSFEMAARSLDVGYFPSGTRVLSLLGRPSAHLWIIRKGTVRLEKGGAVADHLEEGELFGYASLLTGSVAFDVVVDRDLLAYRIPESVFRGLLSEPGFARFFTEGLAARLRRAIALPGEAAFSLDVHASVGSLVKRALVTVPASATAGDAARAMAAGRVSSVLVMSSPPGIVTDRDLRNRVLAKGLGPDTPVASIATAPLTTVPADTPVYGAWHAMVGAGIHHLPVTKDGSVTGIITGTDLLKEQSFGPLQLLKRVESIGGREGLAGYGADLARMVSALSAGGLPPTHIARLVSHLNDALVKRLLDFAEADLGPAPSAWAWIVFGSEGRFEQALLTDQDNALIWADDAGDGSGAWFTRFAELVVADLVAAGFPPCAGGYMATVWRGPLDEWVSRFRSWLEVPEAEAILKAAIFFDFRRTGGTLDLSPISRVITKASSNAPFLSRMAGAALHFRPQLGPFRTLRDDAGRLDLKKSGIAPIVGLARVYALDAGATSTNTLERLAAAAESGFLPSEAVATLSEAFPFLLGLRLREQLRAVASGATPMNAIELDALSAVEKRHLKEVFLAIRDAQQDAAQRYHVSFA